jgi:hypothetical protein
MGFMVFTTVWVRIQVSLGYDAMAVSTQLLLAKGVALYMNYSFACLQGDHTASHHIVCSCSV